MTLHKTLNTVLLVFAIALAVNFGLTAGGGEYKTEEGLTKSSGLFFVNTAEAQPNLPGVDPNEDMEFVDEYCSTRLFGTLSAKTCWDGCTQLGYACVKAITHPATDFTKLEEDIDCYTCKKLTCPDFGRLDVPGRNACDARVDKRSVPAAPLPDGTPCWKCRDAEKCDKKFKKASWLPACQWNCRGKDFQCVKVGVHDTKDCYECQKKPKPPKTCKDANLLEFGQCDTCQVNQNCVPAGVVAQNGKNCFKCVDKKKPPQPPVPPEQCEDVPGFQTPPCECGPRDYKHDFEHEGLDCCLCLKDECAPDGYNIWDCVKGGRCHEMGGVCEPRTRVRGGPECYNCRIPDQAKETCEDHGLPQTCDPNPCEVNETCEERGVVLSGKEMACAFCEPKDETWQPDSACNEKKLQTSCAQCYQAQMACEQIKISDDPEKWCAKCKEPIDRRCPQGQIEGTCVSEVCTDDLRCVDADPGCHICIPSEQCLPGRYQEPTCDNKCEEGTNCQRIEGCEQYGDDPRDVQIEETPEDVKYCGPDGTQALLESITRIRNRVNRLSSSEKGVVDGTMFLDKNGMSIDLRMRPITKQDSSMVCPSKPCTSGTMKTVGLCGQCVMSHILNDILYGFISNQLGVPWHIQLAGAHYAEYTSYGGLDPLSSQAAYMMGNDASSAMGNGALSIGDLCSLLNQTSIKTSALGSTNGFELMGKEQGFLKDCRPCAFPAVGTLKDFSEGDWTLEDKSKDHYPKPPQPAIEPPPDCCYACLPYEEPKCEDSRNGSCDSATCSEAETCVPVGNECHLCEPKSCEEQGFQEQCPTGEECAPVMTQSGEECCECYTPQTDPPPKTCPNDSYGDQGCDGACEAGQECVPYDSFFDVFYEVDFSDPCFVCADLSIFKEDAFGQLQDEEIFTDGFESGDTTAWTDSTEKKQIAQDSLVGQIDENPQTVPSAQEDQCPRGTFTGANCGGTCDSNQECILDGKNDIFDFDNMSDETNLSDVYRKKSLNCYKCVERSQMDCPIMQYKSSDCGGYCAQDEECVTAATAKQRYNQAIGGGLDGFSYATPNSREDCFTCVKKPFSEPPRGCDDGYYDGACNGTCNEKTENCFQRQGKDGPCHICREKRCDAPLIDGDQCDQCTQSGGTCNPVYTNASSIGYAPLCYECISQQPCPPGTVCDCGVCYEGGQVCMPAGRGDDGGMCYRCIPRGSIVVVEYYIVIIETPYARYILDRDNPIDPMQVGGFEPRSIMALARADSMLGNFGSMLGSLQQVSSVFKGAQMVSLQGVADLIQENLAGRRKFGDNCFEKSFTQAPAKQIPPGDAGASSAKKARDTSTTGGIGQNGAKDYIADGPIVACGQTAEGEDAIKVFDASGRVVQTITSEEMEDNPNLLVSGLLKAQAASQHILDFKRGGIKGLMQKALGKAQTSAKHAINSVFQVSEDEGETVPNDMFYDIPEKKKKKFLGIFGSSADNKMPTGSGLSIGGFGIGGSGNSREESNSLGIPDQWGIKRIGYLPFSNPDSAWRIADGNKQNVIVAVIDSGLDMTHEDAPEFVWANPGEVPGNGQDDDGNGYVDDVRGWNFLEDNNDLTDYKGHGTFVSGIIAAKTNNAKGIAGINPGAVIMPLKVANVHGELNSLNVYRAIYYAVNNGARVINISLGSDGVSQLEQSAINYAYLNGVFVAVASGNTNAYLPDIGPASAKRAFAVGAIDFDGERSVISSSGPGNALLAPGEEIFSLRSQDSFHKRSFKEGPNKYYFRQSGTSFSTPMVSATAALMLSVNPKLIPDQITDILLSTANDMGEVGWDGETGAGLLNATQALSKVKSFDASLPVIKIENFQMARDDRERYIGVDVYATIRGGIKDYTISVGKGERARRFKQVGGVLTDRASNQWIMRISKDDLRGSREWIVKIEATDAKGEKHFAQTLLTIQK